MEEMNGMENKMLLSPMVSMGRQYLCKQKTFLADGMSQKVESAACAQKLFLCPRAKKNYTATHIPSLLGIESERKKLRTCESIT